MMEDKYKALLQAADDVVQVARTLKFDGISYWAVPDRWFDHLVKAIQDTKAKEV